MTIEESLIQEIVENPNEEFPRLVYADWLEEHGREKEAEAIRIRNEMLKCKICGGMEYYYEGPNIPHLRIFRKFILHETCLKMGDRLREIDRSINFEKVKLARKIITPIIEKGV